MGTGVEEPVAPTPVGIEELETGGITSGMEELEGITTGVEELAGMIKGVETAETTADDETTGEHESLISSTLTQCVTEVLLVV